MSPEESGSLATLKSMLKSLAMSRIQNKSWNDSEEEVSETQVFKIGEALRPFYFVAAHEFDQQIEIPLDKTYLNHDTSSFFSTVIKEGFFPSPYSAVSSNDQYTDFAAFIIDFADLVLRYPDSSDLNEKTIKKPAKSCLLKAIDFLIDSQTYLEDENGVRWAGTATPSRVIKKGKVRQNFTNTYFTSIVVLALNRAHEISTLVLPQDKKEKITDLIRKAGKWIASRENKGLLSGDDNGELRQLFYTTWGIRALAETYHLQEAPVRDLLKAVAATYVETLDQALAKNPVQISQDYIQVFSTELETLLPYEERSSWTGTLLALISLSRVQELEAIIEATSFSKVLDSVFNGVMALRDPATNLWYQGYFIISIHSYLAEILTRLSGLPPRLLYSFEVTASLSDRIVQETLSDLRLLKLMQQLVYEKMSRLATRREQDKKLSQGLSQIGSEQKSQKPKTISPSVRARKKAS